MRLTSGASNTLYMSGTGSLNRVVLKEWLLCKLDTLLPCTGYLLVGCEYRREYVTALDLTAHARYMQRRIRTLDTNKLLN
jgi:hypothetical protein